MFKILTKKKKYRTWELKLRSWIVHTPFFMPIATVWAVKWVNIKEIKKMWAEIILSNTYHLHLTPWEMLIKKMWWLWKFMNWKKPILTDSGWFQVFSLAKLRKISEHWVMFNSHIGWEKILLTPEKVVEIQWDLWVDITMVLDECPAFPCEKKYALESLELTTRWAKRALNHFYKLWLNKNQKIFAIVQWSTYKDLRKISANQLTKMDFDWFALWWLAVWESNCEMYDMLDTTVPHLPENKPRYLMWVWTPENILEAVERWIDMFDCVIPTRNARHWRLYTSEWVINIKNSKYKEDNSPIDKNCKCDTCKNHSKSYIRHLLSIDEILWMSLASVHNIYFYLELMKNIRESINIWKFEKFKKDFLLKIQSKN